MRSPVVLPYVCVRLLFYFFYCSGAVSPAGTARVPENTVQCFTVEAPNPFLNILRRNSSYEFPKFCAPKETTAWLTQISKHVTFNWRISGHRFQFDGLQRTFWDLFCRRIRSNLSTFIFESEKTRYCVHLPWPALLIPVACLIQFVASRISHIWANFLSTSVFTLVHHTRKGHAQLCQSSCQGT